MLNLKPYVRVGLLTLLANAGNALAANHITQMDACVDNQMLFLNNGKIITMNEEAQIAHSVLIRGNRIVAINPPPADQNCVTVIDLKGKTVVPGLIDSHLHFIRQGQAPGMDTREAESARSIQGLQAMLKKAASQLPKGELISVIGGISKAQFDENRLPTLKELDRAVPDHPVYIQLGFAGPALTNSHGITLFGQHGVEVNKNGVIPKGKETNMAYAALQAMSDFNDKVRGIRHLMTYANSLGMTTVFDEGGTSFVGASYFDPAKDYLALKKIHHDNQMTLRIRLQHTNTEKQNHVGKFEENITNMAPLSGDSMLRYTGTGEHIVSFPVKGKVNPLYKNKIEKVAALGWSHEQHSVSAEENRQHLAMIEEVDEKTPVNRLRWSLSHVFELGMPETRDLLTKLKTMNMGLRVQNHGYHTRTDTFPLGRSLKGKNAGPLYRTLIDENLPLGAGSDGALLGPMNPWFSIYYMVTGKNNHGEQVNPKQHLTRLEALRLYTIGNAWFSFEEKELGSIATGKLADLVVLDRDYLTVPEQDILAIQSELTILDGKIVYRKKEPVH